jgi:hypothetical protein
LIYKLLSIRKWILNRCEIKIVTKQWKANNLWTINYEFLASGKLRLNYSNINSLLITHNYNMNLLLQTTHSNLKAQIAVTGKKVKLTVCCCCKLCFLISR